MLAAATSGDNSQGGIFTSTDSGQTWRPSSPVPGLNWPSVACSADGTRLVAVGFWYPYSALGYPVETFLSSDSGRSWTQANLDAGSLTDGPGGAGVASSADGTHLVGFIGSRIFAGFLARPLLPLPPPPELDITTLASSASISWIVPSSGFALQQNENLSLTTWADVSTSPTLHLTNLHYEVAVCLTNRGNFYRLKQQ